MSKYKRESTYNKLVRDKIPEIIEQDDLLAITKILTDKEMVEELKKKLLEEATEFTEAESIDDQIVELADLREVEMALTKKLKIDESLIEKIRLERRELRGGFDENIYLVETKETKIDIF